MRHQHLLPLIFALLLPTACAQAAPPKPDFADLPGYLKALNNSTDPEALAIRQRITDGPAELARERIAAEKEGLLTRVDQLQPPLPPASQNAAPLYVQLDALRKQKPLRFPMYAQGLNGRYVYTPEQIAVVQKEYDARKDIFTLLHQATDKPLCVIAEDQSNVFSFPPEYAGMRENAREIETESWLIAYRDKYADAVANQERGFRIATHTSSRPKLIGFLVASAMESITLNGMQSILQRAGPDAALDGRMEADILALTPLSMRHALSGEPVVGDAEFSLLRHAKPAEIAQAFQDDATFLGQHTVPASARFTPAEQAQVNMLLDAAQAEYLHQMRRLAAAADLTSAERRMAFREADASAKANRTDPIEALSDHFNSVVAVDAVMFSSVSGKLDQQADRATARRLVTAAGAAMLAAKAQTGTFPDVLPAKFIDPFTNKPLGYRREGLNGFVVYSAGPDGTFDGGKPGDTWNGQQSLFRYPLVPVPIPADMLK